MSTIAIILLATFTAADVARIKLDKAGELQDVRAFEHGAIRAVDDSDAASAGAALASMESPPALSRAATASAGAAFASLESSGFVEPRVVASSAGAASAPSASPGFEEVSLNPASRKSAALAGAAFASLESALSRVVASSAGAAPASLESPGFEESALARAVAALGAVDEGSDAFIQAIAQDVNQSDLSRALGDTAIQASIAKLDAIQVKLKDLLPKDSLKERQELYEATGLGKVDKANDLVKEGVNVNLKDLLKMRQLLFEATALGNVDRVNELVKAGVNVNLNVEPGWVWSSSVVERNGRPEFRWKGTPLQHAAKEGQPEVVRALLKAGAEKDGPDEDGKTPLWHAAQGTVRDSIGVMRVLLEAKANTASVDTNFFTPLHVAASKGRDAAVRMLLDFGADVDCIGGSFTLFGGKTRGSPLVWSTGKAANPEVARILLEKGADPDLANRTSPLHNCAFWDHAQIARLLLEADANKDATDEGGETPLFVAAKEGSTEVARILIKAGASSCLSNVSGQTPITVAKNDEIRKMLEEAGDC